MWRMEGWESDGECVGGGIMYVYRQMREKWWSVAGGVCRLEECVGWRSV